MVLRPEVGRTFQVAVIGAVAVAIVGLAWLGSQEGVLKEYDLLGECARPCPGIELRPEVVLGHPDDPVLLNWYSRAAFAGGLYGVSRAANYNGIPVFSANGAFRDVVGRRGQGPGEFTAPLVFAGPKNQLWAVDIPNQRITSIDSTARIVSAVRFEGAIWEAAVVDSARVVASGIIQDGLLGAVHWKPDMVHVLGGTGEVELSLRSAAHSPRAMPRLAVSPDRRLWVARGNEYRLEEWSVEGQLVRTFGRSPSWFHTWATASDSPRSILAGLRADQRNRLWVFIEIPDPDRKHPSTENGRVSLETYNGMIDTVVEVVDVDRAEVIARQTFPGMVRPVYGGGSIPLLQIPVEDDLGYVSLHVYRAVLPE